MLTSVAGHAGPSDAALRLSCIGAPGVEVGPLSGLCRTLAAGIAGALTREVVVVDGTAADVVLVVSRLDKRAVRARLQWSGAEPGLEVDLGSADSALTDRSLERLVSGLLAVSPPP